jgi:23S rRNA G2445 N2-methylase RlmL
MASGAERSALRLVGPPETNKAMAAELSRLARRALGRLPDKPARPASAMLLYPWDVELAWVAAAYHRTSARVLWDLWRSKARRLEPLYDELRAQVASDSRRWCAGAATISIDVRNAGHVEAGPRQIVGAVKNALLDGAGAAEGAGRRLRVDPNDPDVSFWVRGHDDELTVSIDLTGRPRHLRGYRTSAGAAPLREPLAAALLMIARWDSRTEALLDPMAGAGTIALEAALMARAAPLWPAAELAAARLPDFKELAARPLEPLFADAGAVCLAADRDPKAVSGARANRRRAGTGDQMRVELAEVAAIDRAWIDQHNMAGGAKPSGLILTNPPYGVRLQPADLSELTALYRQLGDLSRRLGWRMGMLAADPAHIDAVGWRPRVRKNLRAGDLRIELCLFDPP